MSVPNWLQDGQGIHNSEVGGFAGTNDPMLGFMQPESQPPFDFNHVQGQQFQAHMQNGNTINGSPASLNAMYQTQSSVPAKRSRQPEDNIGGSPQPYSGSLPASRSQTPHGHFAGFQNTASGASFQPNPPYQHMQHSNVANIQSPSMQTQAFNPPAGQQRASPFSPANQNFTNHASPSHSEHASRVNTPHNTNNSNSNTSNNNGSNNGPNYPSGSTYGSGSTQSFAPSGGAVANGSPFSSFIQPTQQDPMSLESRMRPINQPGPLRGVTQHQGMPFNPPAHLPNQMSNVHMAQMRAQQAQQGMPNQPQMNQHQANSHQMLAQILHSMGNFARQRNLPFDAQPQIAGKVLSSAQLFLGVFKMGGSKRITMGQQWPRVAHLLGYPQHLWMNAAQDLQHFWQTNLADFEQHWFLQQQHSQVQQQQQQRQKVMSDARRTANPLQHGDPNMRPNSFSPPRPIPEQPSGAMNPPMNMAAAFQSPSKPSPAAQLNGRVPNLNGHPDGLGNDRHGPAADPLDGARGMMSQPPGIDRSSSKKNDATAAKIKFTAAEKRASDLRPRQIDLTEMYPPVIFQLELAPWQDLTSKDEAAAEENKLPLSSHGGLPIADREFNDSAVSLLKYKLRAPRLDELGVIDLPALTLSIRSGLRSEIRHALDTVVSISMMPDSLPLDKCEDLLEALVECADDQVEYLTDHTSEVFDPSFLVPYEEHVKLCQAEARSWQEPKPFGDLERELQGAVDRLICITSILRNLAESEISHRHLSDPSVLRLMSAIIRLLGTRPTAMQSCCNALDVSKDVVVFLSHTSLLLEFQNRDEASSITHFLLSFAPIAQNDHDNDKTHRFPAYESSLHQYLPHAVNAMAKLFTKEANRNLCRSILCTDSSPAHTTLLSKAFGLAISVIPDEQTSHNVNAVTSRVPFIAQGLLAAEMLAGMIPGSDHRSAYDWLSSEDCFIARLMRIVLKIANNAPTHIAAAQAPGQRPIVDPFGLVLVALRGLALVHKLLERAREHPEDMQALPKATFPDTHSVMSALLNDRTDPELARRFCQLLDLQS